MIITYTYERNDLVYGGGYDMAAIEAEHESRLFRALGPGEIPKLLLSGWDIGQTHTKPCGEN